MLERMEYPFSAKETYLALTLMTRHATVKCTTFPRLLKYPLFVFHRVPTFLPLPRYQTCKNILNSYILGWQLSNCGFFLENQRQFFHGIK